MWKGKIFTFLFFLLGKCRNFKSVTYIFNLFHKKGCFSVTSYFLGHDIGTGEHKAVIMDCEGNILAVSTRKYVTYYPKLGWAEQKPEDWWKTIIGTTRELLKESKINPSQIKSLSFSTHMVGVLPVDKNIKPLRHAIIWLDSRAEEEADEILGKFGVENLLNLVGGLPGGKDAVSKILWLKKNEPETYRKTYKILDVKDYLIYLLTGKIVTDYSCASVRGTFNMGKRVWSEEIAEAIGVPVSKYPEIKESTETVGTLTREAAEKLGLKEGTVVVNGTGDVTAACVGSGAVERNRSHLYLGSSGWVGVILGNRLMYADRGMGTICSADPENWLLVAETESAGACLKWFIEQFGLEERVEAEKRGVSVYKVFDEKAAKTMPGSGKVIFLPWLYGERSPIPDIYARGGFLNISLSNRKEELMRSILEGVAFNFKWIIEGLSEVNIEPKELNAVGGGALSDLWLQIIADVTGKEIKKMVDPQQASSRGAALIAAMGINAIKGFNEVAKIVKTEKIFKPREEYIETYENLYENFKESYEGLSEIFTALNSE